MAAMAQIQPDGAGRQQQLRQQQQQQPVGGDAAAAPPTAVEDAAASVTKTDASASAIADDAPVENSDGDPTNRPRRRSRRKRLRDRRTSRWKKSGAAYNSKAAELYFLLGSHSLTDLPTFKKMPTPDYLSFLESRCCPPAVLKEIRSLTGEADSHANASVSAIKDEGGDSRSVEDATTSSTAAISSSAAPAKPRPVCAYTPKADYLPPVQTGANLDTFKRPDSPLPTITSYSQDHQYKVKQEAWVLRRVHELTREGMWTHKRVPKVCERPRQRTHWDCLLQEMQWLSVDFYQERQWKKEAARVIAYSAKEFVEHWEEKKRKARAVKERRMRKVASFVAGEVRAFWDDLAQFLHVRDMMDLQRDDGERVKPPKDYAEKNSPPAPLSPQPATHNVAVTENGISKDSGSDECEDDNVVDDFESTISEQERFEEESGNGCKRLKEIKELTSEMEAPLTSLLPQDYPQTLLEPESAGLTDSNDEMSASDDDNDVASSNSWSEDEDFSSLPVLVERVHLSRKQARLYDDYLSSSTVQNTVSSGDSNELKSMMLHLRRICNDPALISSDDSALMESGFLRVGFPRVADAYHHHKRFRTMLDYDPFTHFDLTSLNLVFLAHESVLTAITSNRIGKFCAPRKLIEELPDKVNSPPPAVPQGRILLETSLNIRGGIAFSGKVVPKDKLPSKVAGSSDPSPQPRAFDSDSLRVIASFNERRCKGLPLYGQDLVNALTVVDSVRPSRTRFKGMGFVNCLNAHDVPPNCHRRCRTREMRYKTSALRQLVSGPPAPPYLSLARRMASFPPGPINLVQSFSVSIHTAEERILPQLYRLAEKYSVARPLSSCREETPMQTQSLTADSTKLDRLFQLLRDFRRRRQKALVFCDMDDLREELSARLRRARFPFVDLHSGRDFVRQVARFTKVSSNVCLLLSTRTPPKPSEIAATLVAPHLIFLDTPLERIPMLASSWLTSLDKIISIRAMLCEDTLEETLGEERPHENGVVKPATLELLLRRHSGCDQEELKVSPPPDCDEIHSERLLDLSPFLGAFDESEEEDKSPADKRLRLTDFTPLQRYCMKKIDDLPSTPVDVLSQADLFDDDTEKYHWESSFQETLASLTAELEQLAQMPALTYSYEDMLRSWHGRDGQPMPLWTALSAADALEPVDPQHTFLYSKELMDESELPPIYIKKEAAIAAATVPAVPAVGQAMKRTASEAGLYETPMLVTPGGTVTAAPAIAAGVSASTFETKPKMLRREEASPQIPRSLFDRTPPAQLKIRREKLQHQHKFRPPTSATAASVQLNAPATVAGLRHPLPRPQVDAENAPEWLIQEDWALLHAVRELLELPLNLTGVSPAHTPNWDMVSDMVNAVSRIYRGPKQCRNRYECIIVPREEGRILYDVTATATPPPLNNSAAKNHKKKSHKASMAAGIKLPNTPPAKINKAMKTSQLFSQDGNVTWSRLFSNRFEQIKAVANKRTPTTKPLMVNPVQKNSKHAAVLAESGIAYELPLNPIQVAANRAERIQKEKQRSQQDHQQQLAQQQRVSAAQTAANVAQQVVAAQSAASVVTQQQPQLMPVTATASSAPQAVVVGISQPSTGAVTTQQVIVQGTASALGRLAAVQQQQQQQVVGSVQDIASRVTAAANAAAAAAAGGASASTHSIVVSQPSIVSVSNLTQNQLQKLVTAQAAGRGLAAAQAKQLTPAQINVLRQHHATIAKKQQEQQQQLLKARQQAQQAGIQSGATVVGATTSSGQKVSVAVTPGTTIATVTSQGAVTVVTQALAGQPKAHLIRQLSGKTANMRPMTDSEMRILLAKQQQQQQGKLTSIQVPQGQQNTITAQLLSAGIQLQQAAPAPGAGAAPGGTGAGATQVATLVKNVSSSQSQQSVAIPVANVANLPVRTAIRGNQVTASPQQMQLLQRQFIPQRAAVAAAASGTGPKGAAAAAVAGAQQQQKVQFNVKSAPAAAGTAGQQPKVQFSQVKGMPAQLIVSPGNAAAASAGGAGQKQPQAVTVQQIHQIVKSVQPGSTIQQLNSQNLLPHTVLTKAASGGGTAGGATVPMQARVITSGANAAVAVTAAAAAGRPQQQQQIQVVSASASTSQQQQQQVAAALSAARSSGAPGNVVGGAPNVTIDAATGVPTAARQQQQQQKNT